MTCRLPWMTDGTRDLLDEVRELVREAGTPCDLDVMTGSVNPKHVEALAAMREAGEVRELRLIVDAGFLAKRAAGGEPAHHEVDEAIGPEFVRAVRTHAKAARAAGPNGHIALICSANLNANRSVEFYERVDPIAPMLERVMDGVFARVRPGCVGVSQAAAGAALRGAMAEFQRLGVVTYDTSDPLPRRVLAGDVDALIVMHGGSLGGFLPAILARVGSPARVWSSGINIQTDQIHYLATEIEEGSITDLRLYLPPALGTRRASAGVHASLTALLPDAVIWAETHAKALIAEGPRGVVCCTGSAQLAGTGALEFVRVTTERAIFDHVAGMLAAVVPVSDPERPSKDELEKARAKYAASRTPPGATQKASTGKAAANDPKPRASLEPARLSKSWVTPCTPPDDKPRDKFRLNPLQLKIHRTVVKDGCKFTAIVGGWGGGKTGELLFLAKHFALMRPGRTVLVITDTAERYIKVLVPEAEKWLRPSGFVHRVRERRWVHHGTGSSIVFVPYYRPSTRSSSHNPLEGINADANVCLMDEAQTLSPEAAIKATGRLRAKGYPPQMVIFGLPVWGAWWAEMAEREGGVVIRGSSMANRDNLEEGFFEQARERLSDAEYRAMVLGEPQAPEGLVYACWRPAPWPEGNLLPDKAWRYDERMEGRITIDPGVEKPHALVLVHDHAQDIDVIVAEVGGERMAEHEFVQRLLAVAWPREFVSLMPRDGRVRVLLDSGTIDRAARRSATSMHAPMDVKLRSTMDLLINPPGAGPDAGIGMTLWSPEGIRNIVVNGVACVVKWMSHLQRRRLVCLQSVWEAKPSGGARGLRKAIETYKYHHGQPVKHGDEDPLDALRYLAVRHEWIAPVGSVERHLDDSPTRAAGMVRSMGGWSERGAGGFSRGR